jgi:acylglycerol lipase
MAEEELIAKYSKTIPGISVMFPMENWMQFMTEDGIFLHTYRYPCSNPRGVAVFFHGMNSYTQPSGIIAKHLSLIGCETVGYDQRGHGKSGGLRGYVPSIEILIKDALDFIEEIEKLYRGLPMFLLGGSMGGTIVLNLSIRVPEKITGVILINPAIGLHTKLECMLRCLTTCFSSCMPTVGVVKGDLSRSSKNTTLHKYMDENPFYYHGRVKIGTSSALLRAMKDIRDEYHKFTHCVLVIQGCDDFVTSVKRVNEFMKSISVQDKTLLMYPGLPHSILFEEAVIDISEKIKKWVDERIS